MKIKAVIDTWTPDACRVDDGRTVHATYMLPHDTGDPSRKCRCIFVVSAEEKDGGITLVGRGADQLIRDVNTWRERATNAEVEVAELKRRIAGIMEFAGTLATRIKEIGNELELFNVAIQIQNPDLPDPNE